jgi:hypothetical protein
LVRERKWSTHDPAAAIQRSQAYVSKRLRVFEDQMHWPAVVAGDLTVSAAEELLTDPERYRYKVAPRAIEAEWDVPTTRDYARRPPPTSPGTWQQLAGLLDRLGRTTEAADARARSERLSQ